MLCFSSDLRLPVGSEECEAGAAFCPVTGEQKGKRRSAAAGLGFRGGFRGLCKSTAPGLCHQTQRAAISFSVQRIFILDGLNVQKPAAK